MVPDNHLLFLKLLCSYAPDDLGEFRVSFIIAVVVRGRARDAESEEQVAEQHAIDRRNREKNDCCNRSVQLRTCEQLSLISN